MAIPLYTIRGDMESNDALVIFDHNTENTVHISSQATLVWLPVPI